MPCKYNRHIQHLFCDFLLFHIEPRSNLFQVLFTKTFNIIIIIYLAVIKL